MHTFGVVSLLLAALPAALAQTLAPSPTESVGCQPHGDHWHCSAARTAVTAVVTTTTPVAPVTTEDHDHDHEDESTAVLPPSPTESTGCEPHGDHWHCSAARTAAQTAATTPPAAETSETESLPPSPTQSVGCHPHGDHWHCSGPRVTSSGGVVSSAAPSGQPTASIVPGAAAQVHGSEVLTLGIAVVAVVAAIY
ncbi:hypothetical protein VTK73DRAFT_10312 [Phialemonium thermophilum]|uniref:Uncharacterized protein n=1 Tax=Phialemonium thermophilum TaxID=223376 RepID=A0ABR3XG72_9PEZI